MESYRNSVVAVGVAQVVISPAIAPGRRKLILMTNTSAGGERISIALNGNAIDGSSIVLAAGFSWLESIDAVFTPTNEVITAISSGAGGLLAVHERIEAGVQ